MNEQRSCNRRPKCEKRADGAKVISGYAAVFYNAADPGTQYPIFEGMVERISRGAFDNAIKENDDARGAFNHSVDLLLGRRSSGTVTLSVDQTGLLYEITLPDTVAGRDVATLIERGDVTGSSFAFSIYGGKRGRVVWEHQDGVDIRNILDLELYDVGPVTFPAYEATTAAVRSRQELLRERDEFRKSLQAHRQPDEISVRAAMVKLANAKI